LSLGVDPEGGMGMGKETASSCPCAALETVGSPGAAPFLGLVRPCRTVGCAAPVTLHLFRRLQITNVLMTSCETTDVPKLQVS
jgi:hypothetical protein